jgi:hypothetical protein
LFLLLLGLLALGRVHAQPFTKIDTGALVTDGGDSRSVNFVDYDNDGDLDLFVSNGPRDGFPNFLYRNDGNGAFTKITEGPLVTDASPSVGTVWGDYDNDGDLDLFVTNWYARPNQLYINKGDGTFSKGVTQGAPVTDGGYSEAASWGDYDNDGDLDLFVANSEGDLRNALYTNNGDGAFARVAHGAPVADTRASRSVNFVDYDNDGDLDLFVANESSQPNDLYRNQRAETGTATFEPVATGPVVTPAASSISSSWGDYDNDGDLDLFVANAGADENNALYTNNGDGTFTAETDGPVAGDGGSSFGSAWGDYDNDGDLDLFVANAFRGQTTNFLYDNQGDPGSGPGQAPTFARVTEGPIAEETGWTYGSAWGDYDNDGDLDLFIAKVDGSDNVLYRNDAAHGRHWLLLNLVGTRSNRSAIGAVVRVQATLNGAPVWQTREVTAQSGYTGQNLRLHFGLGDAPVIDSLHVTWPSGQQQAGRALAVDQMMTITEGTAINVETGEAARPGNLVPGLN